MCGEDDFAEVVDLFCEEMSDALEGLGDAKGNDAREKLHFIKGSALNIGFENLGRLCLGEEERLKDDPTLAPQVDPIRTVFEASRSELSG